MGYSLGVRARSAALQQKMLAFFDKEYRPFWNGAFLPARFAGLTRQFAARLAT